MITLHKFEGKNLELLKEECCNQLKCSLNDIYMIHDEIDAGLFKGKKIILEAITKEEIKDYIKKYIKELSNYMHLDINAEIRIDEENIKIMLISENNNILIGKDGKTINALQIILRQNLRYLRKFGLNVLLDVSNYKQRKVKRLEIEIRELCQQVLSARIEIKLDPMNSYERRVVHSIVGEFIELKSESYGEDPNRYTVIKIKD